jgi:hypothetical protein
MDLEEVEHDLYVRYSMDHKVWRAATIKSAVHSIPLKYIAGIPLFVPLVFIVLNRGARGINEPYFKTII